VAIDLFLMDPGEPPLAVYCLHDSQAAAASQLRLGVLASHIATCTSSSTWGQSCGHTVPATCGNAALPESDMYCTDDEAEAIMKPLIEGMQAYYTKRGIFQGRFGFGKRPAVIVIDFAYKCVKLVAHARPRCYFLTAQSVVHKSIVAAPSGDSWTDEGYAGGTSRMDEPVRKTAELLAVARSKGVPIVYTTSPDPEGPGAQLGQVKKADQTAKPGEYKKIDSSAMTIDARVRPSPDDLIIEKTTAGAFFGTPLISHLIALHVDTVLLAGCREYHHPATLLAGRYHWHRSTPSDSLIVSVASVPEQRRAHACVLLRWRRRPFDSSLCWSRSVWVIAVLPRTCFQRRIYRLVLET
jgi:isochorismate hydrolase